jgi:hypothetical protein
VATRYVNTASTAGGDGTTNATSGANRAYANLREAIVAFNRVALTEAWTIYCEGTAADTQSITQTHWNNLITNGNVIRIIGNNTTGKYSTSHYRIEVTNSAIIYNNADTGSGSAHVWVENLQGQLTETGTGGDYPAFRLSTANVGSGRTDCDCRFINCIVKGVRSGTNVIRGYYNSEYAGTGTIRLWNCIAYGFTYGFGGVTILPEHWNCTGRSNDFNFIDPQTCRNCISDNPLVGNGFESVGTSGGLARNNASSDGTAPGVGSRINQTFTFNDATNGDFAITDTDAGARGYGMFDPSSSMLFTYDIKGNPRGSWWDIGSHAAPTLRLMDRKTPQGLYVMQRRGIV